MYNSQLNEVLGKQKITFLATTIYLYLVILRPPIILIFRPVQMKVQIALREFVKLCVLCVL